MAALAQEAPGIAAALLAGLLAGLAAVLLTGRLRAVTEQPSGLYRHHVHVPLAALLGAGAGVLAPSWLLVLPAVVLAVACALLVVVDLAEHRLPNRLLALAYPSLLISLLPAALLGPDWALLGRALLAGMVVMVVYLVLALISPAGLGMGDVKFSGLLGLALGWAGWQSVILGVLAAFVLNAVIALLVMVVRRDRRGEVPFGPAMVAGTALALAVT
ncbi:prepilin peptidase [Brachybacterium vulturis]|uniref:Prepilin peptidase n=1 Tax=Brachybacterium vulturis TaxID=2017484 RepID=A0A291GNQ6_9MICO|nr:A24 family peptidase [Brachybacterium vulturis]ATG51861.1 prepilin peptidase [Brachybacterium vulturis]